MQYRTSKDHILPFIQAHLPKERPLRVLEIGCAEAGVLKAFLEKGHQCTGIELSPGRVKKAKQFLSEYVESGQVSFLTSNIYDIDVQKDLTATFDLVILKDVIEHIPQQERFIASLRSFLQPGGMVFFGFPPWQMPFGGHQQIAKSKLLSKLPYYHLLPRKTYESILRAFGEKEQVIEELLEIKDTGISIERFEQLLKKNQFELVKRELFLFNPIYQYKFGLKPLRQMPILRDIPKIRNMVTTCAYYLIREA